MIVPLSTGDSPSFDRKRRMSQKRSRHGRLDPTPLSRFDERMYNKPPLPIEKLPFFGTTWYTQGPAYWFRHMVLSFLALLTLYGQPQVWSGSLAPSWSRKTPRWPRSFHYP